MDGGEQDRVGDGHARRDEDERAAAKAGVVAGHEHVLRIDDRAQVALDEIGVLGGSLLQ